MKTKRCSKCGEVKSISGFYKRWDSKDGYRNQCKKCRDKSDKNWQKNNQEKIKKYRKNWYKNNAERIKHYKEQWYKENIESIRQHQKQYRKDKKSK